ncbi:MAG: hypothetical protein HY560_05355 [Gemmatimonadetes bacterium]|nr:hypothetical protein [Gemmatimonadota bacterium]
MRWLLLATQLLAANQPDSLEVLRTARLAQARFEDVRLRHLPWSREDSRADRCDEVVGRFCFWHDEDDSWRPTPEAPAIETARLQLTQTLQRLQALSPRDPWVSGQLVRYLIEAQRLPEALAAARDCRSAAWWCQALSGYALHAAGSHSAADSAFGAALAAMPEAQRCRWTDLSDLLDGLRSRYRKLTCAQRAAFNRRIWWLADPLYSVPGNERRTEHFTRRVITELQDGAQSGYAVRWGRDLEELVLRYGWPVGWERVATTPSAPGTRTIAHNQREARDFLAPARFVEAPNTIQPDEWELDPDRPVTGYAPPYATAFHGLPHQVAVFRRGDSMVVVAGYDVRSVRREHGHARPHVDERWQARQVTRVEAALVLARDEHTDPIMARGVGSGPEGVMTAIAPADAALLSLETLDRADSVHAARARYWLPVAPVTGAVALSDPLLLRSLPDDSLHPSLADVIPLVRPVARARRGERVGVFWETYGLQDLSAPLRVTLTVTQVGRSWLRKAVEWAGLAKRDPHHVSLSWDEIARSGALSHPRSLAISLPAARPGVYLLEIAVAVPGAPVARAAREITIEPE